MVCSCSLFPVTFLVKKSHTTLSAREEDGCSCQQCWSSGCSVSTEVQFQPVLTAPNTGSPQHFCCQFSFAGTKTHYTLQQKEKGKSSHCRSVLAKEYKSLAGHHMTWFFAGFVHKSMIRCRIFGLSPVVIK